MTNNRSKQFAFTLIELLTVIAIIGILFSVAVPSYLSHVEKSNRIEAQLALTEVAQSLERINARQGDYPASYASSTVNNYTLTYSGAAATYAIIATPSKTVTCGTLTLKSTGETLPSTDGCW